MTDAVEVQELILWHEAPGRLCSNPNLLQGVIGVMSVSCTRRSGFKPIVVAEAYEATWTVPVDDQGRVYAIMEN